LDKCNIKKEYYKNIKSWFIKNRQIISIAIVFFFYVYITYYYQNNFFPNERSDLNATAPTIKEIINKNEFYYSFIASSYEDIIFFALIGIGIFIFSLKKPEDEKLENRMNALFTNHHSVDQSVVNKAKKELKKLAVYSPETVLSITILDRVKHENNGKEYDLLKIGIDREVHLKSMIHDLDNFDTEGKVEFYGEVACPLPNDIYGEINTIELMYDVDNIEKIVTNKQIKNKVFTEIFSETFKKDSKLVLHSNLWLWMKNGDIYEHTSYRTTANTYVSVKNNIQNDIIITNNGSEIANLKADLENDNPYQIKEGMFLEHGEVYSFNIEAK
jgi:hypothetical protein